MFISINYINIYILGPDQVEDIKQHPFFAPINWEELLQRKADPPFKPTIVPDETFHFDSSFTSKTPKGNLHQNLVNLGELIAIFEPLGLNVR
jgi:hypothetical protein